MALAMGAGIVADRCLPVPACVWWAGACGLLVLWAVAWHGRRHGLAVWLLLLAVAAGGAAWHHCRWNLFDADELALAASEASEPVCVEAVALDGPRRLRAPPFDAMRAIPQGDRTRLRLRVVRVRDGRQWQHASGRAGLSVEGHLLGVKAGDRVRVFAQLSRPAAAANPGQFDSLRHYRADRTLCRLRAGYPDCVSMERPGRAIGFRRTLARVRNGCRHLLWRHVNPERSGLAEALLLGMRESVTLEQTQTFLETGTIHLLAISGLHVGILAGALLLLARVSLLPPRAALATVAVLTIVYALVTDARPPVVRATILVCMFCMAQGLLRRTGKTNAIAAAALLVMALNPADVFRVGAQLSFLAVLTLAWFGPRLLTPPPLDPLDRLIAENRSIAGRAVRGVAWWFWRLFLTGMVIWLVALPLTMARFNLISPAGPISTPLLMVPATGALLSGFATLTIGALIPPLAGPLGWFCDANLALLDGIVQTAQTVPCSHFYVSGPDAWWIGVFYAALGAAFFVPRFRLPRRWCVALLAAWIAVGFGASMAAEQMRTRRNELECTFLSVGHGSCTVVRLPEGRTILYDAGSLAAPHSAARTIASFLWAERIGHVDAVILSHADADHYNALPGLLERFSVGAVLVSPVMFENESASLTRLRAAVESAGVPVRVVSADDRIGRESRARLDVLHPPERGVIGPDNANSVVLSISCAGRRILLTGDLDSPGMEDLIAEMPLACDVVAAPHHGSRRSNPAGFADWCRPEHVVISCGRRRQVESVVEAYEQRGAHVLTTAQNGAVRIAIGRTGVDVEPWRTP